MTYLKDMPIGATLAQILLEQPAIFWWSLMPTHEMKTKNDIVKEANNPKLMRLDGLWAQRKFTAIIAITLLNDYGNKVLLDDTLLYSYI